MADQPTTSPPSAQAEFQQALASFQAAQSVDAPSAEQHLMAVIERLATSLTHSDPATLQQIAVQALAAPLTKPKHHHLLQYYRGLARGLQEEYGQALAAFDRLLAEDNLDATIRARTLNSRSIFCRITGRLEEAMGGYRTSLALWQQLGDSLNAGKVLLNLGIISYQLQEYAEAEAWLTAATDLFEELGNAALLASVRNELGLIYRDQGRWEAALYNFGLAAAQRQQEGDSDRWARALNNMGEVQLFQGQLAEADASFAQALAAMTTRLYAVDVHLNLSLVQQAAGQLETALVTVQRALQLAQEIGRRDILAQAHHRVGVLWRQLGAPAAAHAAFVAAATVIEETREPLHDEGLKISLLGRWQQIYEELILHCMELGRSAEAFQWAERARARAFGEALTTHSHLSHGAIAAASIDAHLLATLQGALPPASYALIYFTTGVLDQSMPFLRTLAKDNPLRNNLLTPARTLLFVIGADGVELLHCPVDPNTLTSNSLRHDDRRRFLHPKVLSGLYQMLLPLQQALQGAFAHAAQIYLVPHGPLHNVPFAALRDDAARPLVRDDGPRLIYAPSGRILHHALHAQSPASQREPLLSCLAVGYRGTTHALRHTELEATLIAALVGGTAWTGPERKRPQLARRVQNQRWLHFACHGWFDYETPLASYLETGQDERLTAQEIMSEWRLRAELVTLSACQTGVNRVLRGDEPMGLIRGLLSTGARAVLASQWPVEDLPTFLFMHKFYQALVEPETTAATALQKAQIWLQTLSHAEAQVQIDTIATATGMDAQELSNELPTGAYPLADPRFWAGFVLYVG